MQGAYRAWATIGCGRNPLRGPLASRCVVNFQGCYVVRKAGDLKMKLGRIPSAGIT
jgi:hypothetical protein